MSGQVSTRGTYYTKHFDETLRKGVYETQIPNINFLYKATTTISPDWNIGDRVKLPDGRAFRYCKEHTSEGSGPADPVEAGRGAKFLGTIGDDGVASAVDTAQVVGDSTLHYASQSFAKDELRGGYVIVYSAGSTYQQAGIVGNTYCSSTPMTVYVDREWATVITSTQYTEILPNPYLYVGRDTDAHNSVAGVPMSTPTAGQYFWIQTWGPLWHNPGPDGCGGGSGEQRVCYNVDGSLRIGETLNLNSQMAGIILNMDSLGNDGPPFINLMITP